MRPEACLGGRSGHYSAGNTQVSASHSQPKPWGELSQAVGGNGHVPQTGHGVWPCCFPSQPVRSSTGGHPVGHRAQPSLHQTEPEDAIRYSFAILTTHITLGFSSLVLFQPLITPCNGEWWVFRILEKRSLNLGYWTAVQSSVPQEQWRVSRNDRNICLYWLLS